MSLKFRDYVAKDDDGNETTVSAARVLKEDAGAEFRTTSEPVTVKTGDVVVAPENPDVFDVHSSATWKTLGYENTK